jgi:hypothetical protein
MSKRKKASKPRESDSISESLEGLRDVLDITLTRVMEDDMDVKEARKVLAHLESELSILDRDIRATNAKKKRTGKTRRKTKKQPPVD